MRQFFKFSLATVLGIFLFFFLSILLLIGIGSAFSGDDKTQVESNSVLFLDLNKDISEKLVKNDDFSNAFSGNEQKISFIEIKNAIANAKLDPNISAIELDVQDPQAGLAQLEEIRNQLLDFKKSGKKIYSHAEVLTEKGVYMSSIADYSYLTPVGGVEFNGLVSEVTFIKGMLDKIGVKTEVFKVGDFKSAVEPFIRTDMSPENRLQTEQYLGSISQNLYSQIASAKGMQKTQLDELINQNLIQEPEDALKHKLITHVGYKDEFETMIKKNLSIKSEDKIQYMNLENYSKAKSYLVKGDRANKIAIISCEGSIVSGKNDFESIASEDFVKELKKAREDEKVKAIVLRINSPGGSALASDVMWREIQITKAKKPVIASMSDVAASGGYYMAMGCDAIVAQPNTITGSIGIFGLIMNSKELLNSKLGITFDKVKTHTYADSPSGYREMSEAEKTFIQNSVNKGYETFTSKAAAGRKMPIEKLKSIASGRVWSGTQAKANGLVDVLGGLDVAIATAAEKAKLNKDEYQLKYYPSPKSTLEKFMAGFGSSQEDAAIKASLGEYYHVFKQVQNIQKMEGIQARMPADIKIK
ncbi:MAG: signal peptide peptidase SppA [Leadbetterella sp.]